GRSGVGRRHHEPDAHSGGVEVRPRACSCARRDGDGAAQGRGADQGDRPRARRARGGEPAARARSPGDGACRSADPRRAVRRGGGDPGVRDPPALERFGLGRSGDPMSTTAIPRTASLPEMRRADYGMAAAVVLVLALLVLPMPPALLDLSLALSIGASLAVLLVAMNTSNALDFSTFPTVLLVLTLFRLALNVSSTRLILSEGAAGRVIQAFGEFVIGGTYAVGAIIFLILIVSNVGVITKGAGRIAEVAARSTLDAMPGRQMSIDGDLSAGLIDDVEAKRRREEISREADFYGAMDGAAKFVRGDAIAGLIITALNIVGGIFVGMIQRGLPLSRALADYTVLTVGDGLVSQIPALLVSTAAGIMVTHSAEGERVGSAVLGQVSRQPRALWTSSAFLTGFGL